MGLCALRLSVFVLVLLLLFFILFSFGFIHPTVPSQNYPLPLMRYPVRAYLLDKHTHKTPTRERDLLSWCGILRVFFFFNQLVCGSGHSPFSLLDFSNLTQSSLRFCLFQFALLSFSFFFFVLPMVLKREQSRKRGPSLEVFNYLVRSSFFHFPPLGLSPAHFPFFVFCYFVRVCKRGLDCWREEIKKPPPIRLAESATSFPILFLLYKLILS
jgi:hypothetical protein